MKSRLLERKESFTALLALFAQTETSEIKGMPEALASFATSMNQAEALEQRQARRLDPALESRDAALQTMETAALTLAGRVFSFAQRKGYSDLAVDVRITPRDFRRVRIAARVCIAQHVHDVAMAALPRLAEADITAAEIGEVLAAIEAARAMLVLPRSAIADRVAATAQLDEVYRRLALIVAQQIDPLMVPLRITNPELYRKYKLARSVIRRGVRSASSQDDEGAVAEPASVTTVNAARAEMKLAA